MGAGVLIRGEEGSGRKIAARAIHAARGSGKFVAVDCAAFEGDQLDTELFGTVAKSPNGDDSARGFERVSRNSRLHDALGGTIYMQHVAEAPARVQARFARLLRDREAVLVETGATVGFDVRPMAGVSTTRFTPPCRKAASATISTVVLRRFRSTMPRSRAVARTFRRWPITSSATSARRLRVPLRTLSRPALSLIVALPWRGNAVELRRLLESVVTSERGGAGRDVEIEDVLAHVRLDHGAGNCFEWRNAPAGARPFRARVYCDRARATPWPHQRGGQGARHPADQSVPKDAIAARQSGAPGI